MDKLQELTHFGALTMFNDRIAPPPISLAVGCLIDGVDSLVVLYFFMLTFNSKMGTVLCFFLSFYRIP